MSRKSKNKNKAGIERRRRKERRERHRRSEQTCVWRERQREESKTYDEKFKELLEMPPEKALAKLDRMHELGST